MVKGMSNSLLKNHSSIFIEFPLLEVEGLVALVSNAAIQEFEETSTTLHPAAC